MATESAMGQGCLGQGQPKLAFAARVAMNLKIN
jgi:hypothetical protein